MKLGNECYIIEKIENGVAALENSGEIIEVEASLLPQGAKEGDILKRDSSGYTIDSEATSARRKELFKKQQSIFKRK